MAKLFFSHVGYYVSLKLRFVLITINIGISGYG
jgi:hypothetical protein